jgi:hypothetical protein
VTQEPREQGDCQKRDERRSHLHERGITTAM